MKKMILIGAMLILGATSFSDIMIKLDEKDASSGAKKTYSGEGKLPVVSRGNIINMANRVVLIVEPTTTTGADNTALEFNFGKLLKGESKTQLGEFKARVLKNGKEIPILKSGGESAIDSAIYNNGTKMVTHDTLKNSNRTDIGKILYKLSPGSGLASEKKSYIGKVVAEIALNADTTVGSFEHNSSSIKVTVTDLNISEK